MNKFFKTVSAVLLAVAIVASGLFVISFSNQHNVAKADEPFEVTSEEKSFFLRSWMNDERIRLVVSFASYDSSEVVEFNSSMYNSAERMNQINLYDYVKINGNTLRSYGATFAYGITNAGDCKLNIVLDFSYNSEANPITSITSVEFLKGTQIPSAAFICNESNLVYEAGCRYLAESGAFNYGWQTIGYTDVKAVTYAQVHDGTCGYIGFDLYGDDYAGIMAEMVDGFFVKTNYSSKILVNNESGKIMDYSLFSLGKGDGMYNSGIYVKEEDVESVTIPAGTIFPSRFIQDRSEVDQTAYANLFYQTEKDVTFIKDGNGGFREKSNDPKDEAIQAIRAYKANIKYRRADQALKDSIISQAIEQINQSTEEQWEAIINKAKADIDAIKTADQRAEADATFEFTTKDVALYCSAEKNKGFVRIIFYMPEYDSEVFEFNRDLAEGIETRLARLNILDTCKINGKALTEYNIRPEHFRYGFTNAYSPKNSILLDYGVDGIESIESFEVLSGAQIPSYGFICGDVDNPVVYRAAGDFKSIPGEYAYGWSVTSEIEIDSLAFVADGVEGDEIVGHFAISLTNDDFDCAERFEVTNIGLNFGAKLYVNGDSSINPVRQLNYMLDGSAYFGSVWGYEQCKMVTISAGAEIMSLSSLKFAGINSGNIPRVIYVTKSDKTFVAIENNQYITLEEYKQQKITQVAEYRATKVNDNYFGEQIKALDQAVETARNAIDEAATLESIETAIEQAKAAIDEILEKSAYIQNANEELDSYKVAEGYYRDAELAERNNIVAEAKTAIQASTSESEIQQVVANAKAAIDNLKTAAQYADEEFATAKANAIQTITELNVAVNYLEEQQQEVLQIVETGKTAVENAVNEEEINTAVSAAQEAVASVVTKAQVINDAKTDIDGYKADVEYKEEELAKKTGYIQNAKTAIDAATSQKGIEDIVASVKEQIDTLKTKEEYDSEKLSAKKEEIGEQINQLSASIDLAEYSEANQAEISRLLNEARNTVTSATTETQLENLMENLNNDINAIEKISNEPEDTGCASSVANFTIILSLLMIVSVVIITKRRNYCK